MENAHSVKRNRKVKQVKEQERKHQSFDKTLIKIIQIKIKAKRKLNYNNNNSILSR